MKENIVDAKNDEAIRYNKHKITAVKTKILALFNVKL